MAYAWPTAAVPETGWLTGSGPPLDDGVVCDAHCRAADVGWNMPEQTRPHRQALLAEATAAALAVAA